MIHEAVEALGNMNNYDSHKLLRKLEAENSPHTTMVRVTVQLARDLLRWNKKTNCGATEDNILAKILVRTNEPEHHHLIIGRKLSIVTSRILH